ncbi:MAG: hypothetical protein IJW05_00775 [Lentisphaeria bacterium]|nr:hypothetical protein [Lentisphaeria bacterium]
MKKIMMLAVMFCAAAVTAAEFSINNRIPATGFTGGNDSWKYEQKVSFANAVPEEFLIPPKQIKTHKKHAYIKGFNGDLVLQIKAPGPVKTLEWSAIMTNFADKKVRKISLSYSLDGVTYKELAVKDFTGKATLSSGKITLPENRGYLTLKMQRHVEKSDTNGRYGFILWQEMDLKLTGSYSASAGSAAVQDRPKRLQEVFPTGVFWAWERTKPNAELAGMEFWEFVEYSMKTLKDNGYNTCWFVNINSVDDQVKVLALAEKHGLQVLTNTDLLHVFYGVNTSLDQMQLYADRTVARIGHSKALLGYVLKDEPLMCDIDTCGYFYDLMRKADPSRDSISVTMNRQTLSYLRDSKLPVVCSDVYYFGADDSTMLPSGKESQQEFTNAFNAFNLSAERHGKHSWIMGQIFGDIWGRHWYKDGKFIVYPGCYLHWKMPTEAESRWQVWEALRLGTKGVLFYVYHSYVPMMRPPEQASTPAELKLLAKMDRMGKTAASWKNQKLTTGTIELEWSSGMLHPGGKPTKQMQATAPVMKLIRANEQLLLARKRAEFPVFFPADTQTDVQTFRSNDRWLGIIVNRDVKKTRTVDVLLPRNVKTVKDLATGRNLKISQANAHFQKISLTLEPGSGVMLEPEFFKQAGIRCAKESFDHQTIFRMMINTNAEIFHHGNYGADEQRSLRLKKGGNPGEAVCAFIGISNPKTAVVTLTKNLTFGSKGTLYCLVNGKLSQGEIRAVIHGVEGKGEQANFAHLRVPKSGKLAPMNGKTIKKDQFHLPAVVPNDATALEFFLGPKDYIEDITLWFVPDPPAK